MDTYTENKIIHLNSKDAQLNNSTSLSDVYFYKTGILKDEDDIVERYIQIQNAQIPYSFYNINVYNNQLSIQISSTIYTITLTLGNYNATTLIREMITQFANNGISDISISISQTTGILQFKKTTGSFSILSTGSTIYKVLGFVPGITYNSISLTITAPYPMNLLGTLRLRLCSYELITSNNDFVLITIPIDVGNFGLIQYINTANINYKLNNLSLDGFDIMIIDDDNNLINFNNINWTMTILLTIVRRKKIINNIKFRDVVSSYTEPPDDQEQIPQDEQIPEDIPQDVPIPETEPITDDLDVLLYNNHGQIF